MGKHKVLDVRLLTETAYVVKFERDGLQFIPGQHIYVGLPGDENRPYSVYSGENEDFVEILVKEIHKGNVSRKLKSIELDSFVEVDDAQGHFSIKERLDQKLYFVATGTGIAPFHSFIKSYPNIDYTLIHGVSHAEEGYGKAEYEHARHVLCTSRDREGDFKGRVTDYVKGLDLDKNSYFFLCGNSAMIDDVYDILLEKGLTRERIRTEIYF
jgi:ferredoxin/flavodoxin---NADP+ reductase